MDSFLIVPEKPASTRSRAVSALPARPGVTLSHAAPRRRAVRRNPLRAPEKVKDLTKGVVAEADEHLNAMMVKSGLRTVIASPVLRRSWPTRAITARRHGSGLRSSVSEKVERSFAHAYETGGLRRTSLRGHENIAKRVLVHLGALNLGILLCKKFGVGTPRGKGRRGRFLALLLRLYRR
jgi:hypothetical protein